MLTNVYVYAYITKNMDLIIGRWSIWWWSEKSKVVNIERDERDTGGERDNKSIKKKKN